ncbi:MAG: DUF2971 domain-containing protein [Elusimicrobiaceae bacterium]|nr:DUF2971 domain-containing protein [Elusimicrobiaceae bacterium]
MKKCFYKYRPLADEADSESVHRRVKDILQEGKLYFPCPKDFNDPFDGVIEYDETVTPEDIRPLGIRIGVEPKQLQNLIDIYKRNPDKFYDIVRQQNVKFQNDNKLRILCLSDTELNPLLWAHYAAQHTGVCIGFRTYKLDDKAYGIKLKTGCIDSRLLDPYFPDMIIPFPVEYTEEVPHKYHFGIGNAEDLKKSFLCKSVEWAYEKEVRVVATDSTLIRNPVEIDVNEIEEIIFGIRASSKLIEQVKDIISQKPYVLPGPKLYQCQRISGTYRLEKKPLE